RLERLSTPGRRRGAFLGHFARCRTIAEAAARAGIDRRTVHRWRKTIPKFDERCLEILETRRREAVENVILGAGQVEVRPVFYRGRRVGEVTRRDRTLDLYLVKQADAALARAEKRREAEADFEARVAAEVARRLAALSPPAAPAAEPSPAQQPAPAASVDSAAAPEDTPAILKTSPSAGHEVSPPAGETPCPANDLAAAPRTVPSGLSAPENVPDRGA
ncbi:MAG: helix-turn-helix domain-containing protein, partial [Reyranella sp.]|nr:helix-turn-helix domain-containing protein [Reyranella sp.]